MAASKLYPTLSKFYEDRHTDLDSTHSAIPDVKLYRKDTKRNHADIVRSIKNNSKQNQLGNFNKNVKPDLPHLYPDLSNKMADGKTTRQRLSQENELYTNHQVIPSAPPVELVDEDVLRFIEDALMEQSLSSPTDEIPVVDYSSLTLSSNSVLNDSWIDDLQPDYDVYCENVETGLLNNLDKTDIKISKDKSFILQRNAGHSVELNIFPEGKKPEFLPKKGLRKYQKVHEQSELIDVPAAHRLDRGQVKKDPVQETENRAAVSDASRHARPSPESLEYNAWMTWRKQVNRQLATTILLRQGAQMKLQKSDLSRKHLNQRSIDFVSNVVKPGNRTSLGGKPFLMYGIPRASLSGSQRELNEP